MSDDNKLDDMLKRALTPDIAPSKKLNESIQAQIREGQFMKKVHKKRFTSAIIAASMVMLLSITVVAATRLLTPPEVAKISSGNKLAKAFESEDAVVINETIVSGDYKITLNGMVSGAGLSELAGELNPERTYAIVAIAKKDGSKMPTTQDENYGKVPFFVSPLIKGQKPWQVNIASMGGGYHEFESDGIMYRLIECDSIEMFADRGVYICVSTSGFYDINAFRYDEKTGVVSPSDDYDGVNVLFDLPLDKARADHQKAEQYLKNIYGDNIEAE